MGSEGSIKNEFVSFRSRWSANIEGGDSFIFRDSNQVSKQKNELIKVVSIEEIRRALWSTAKDKVPELDGFPLFFKRY